MTLIRALFFVAGAFGYAQIAQSQPDTSWTKSYDFSSNDIAHALAQCEDGGFVLAGCMDCLSKDRQGLVVKVDEKGVKSWVHRMPGTWFFSVDVLS